MSLINKVLTDLEARSGAPAYGQPARPLYEDLRPVRATPARTARKVPVVVLLVVSVAAAALYGAGQWGVPAWQEAVPADSGPVAAPPVAAPPETPASLAASTPTPAIVAPLPQPVAAVTDSEATAPAPVQPANEAVNKNETVKKKAAAKPRVEVSSVDAGAIDKKAKPLTPTEQAENAYRSAGVALKRQDRVQAERELKSALALNAKHTPARELYAGLLLEQGRTPEAQRLLERGLAKSPAHYAFAILLARTHLAAGNEHQALAVLQQARTHGQGDADFLALSAALAQRVGRHGEAITDYSAAVRLQPSEARWWAGLGISLEAQQRWTQAREAYEHARATGLPNGTLARHVEQRLHALKDRRD